MPLLAELEFDQEIINHYQLAFLVRKDLTWGNWAYTAIRRPGDRQGREGGKAICQSRNCMEPLLSGVWVAVALGGPLAEDAWKLLANPTLAA